MSVMVGRDLGTGVTIDLDEVTMAQKYAVAILLSVAIYNALEVIPFVYFTFPKYSGLYFWSVMAADLGVLVYASGFVLNNFQLTGSQTLPAALIIIAWIPMVLAQSLVLYSRLHLVNLNERIRRWAFAMIMFTGITLGISTVVCSAGSNGAYAELFLVPYTIIERIQITGFFLQEIILSGLYVWKAWEFLHGYRWKKATNSQVQQKLRAMMINLIVSNVIVVVLDITILALQFSGLYFIQVSYKAFVYSVKLKCELGILGRLVEFVKAAAGPCNRHHHCNHHSPKENNNNNRWSQQAPKQHECHDPVCADNDAASFQLSSQVEREWQTTLRNTFGVALGPDNNRHEKRDASGSSSSKRHSAGDHDNDDDDGGGDAHPGQRVLGLLTITSGGGGSRVQGSVDGESGAGAARRSALSTSTGTMWSSSFPWEPAAWSTPPAPEMSYSRQRS